MIHSYEPSRRRIGRAALLFTAVFIGASAAATNNPPHSRLYVTLSHSNEIVRIDGDDTLVAQMHGFSLEAPLAVDGRIRTVSLEDGREGAQYDLDLNAGDRVFAHSIVDEEILDATTDGTFIYAVSVTSGDVIRFKPDWTRPEVLFTLSGASYGGITYDPSNHTLWIAEFGDRIGNYDMQGNLLSQFDLDHISDLLISFLALDHADGSLWFGDFSRPRTVLGYTKAGEHRGGAEYFDLNPVAMLGGEFDLGAAAKIKDVKIAKGDLVRGDVKSLRRSDENRMRIRAEEIGDGLSQIEAQFKCKTKVANPTAIDVVIDGHIDTPEALGKILLRNWRTGEWDQVEAWAPADEERRVTAYNIDATDYVNEQGKILARVCQIAFEPLNPRWRSSLNVVQVRVR